MRNDEIFFLDNEFPEQNDIHIERPVHSAMVPPSVPLQLEACFEKVARRLQSIHDADGIHKGSPGRSADRFGLEEGTECYDPEIVFIGQPIDGHEKMFFPRSLVRTER